MSAKHAIDDKLQGSVDTYLRRGGVVNNQIKKGYLLSLWVKKITVNIWQKLQARTWLSRALSPSFSSVLARRAKCTRQSEVLRRHNKTEEAIVDIRLRPLFGGGSVSSTRRGPQKHSSFQISARRPSQNAVSYCDYVVSEQFLSCHNHTNTQHCLLACCSVIWKLRNSIGDAVFWHCSKLVLSFFVH